MKMFLRYVVLCDGVWMLATAADGPATQGTVGLFLAGLTFLGIYVALTERP